MMCPAEAINRLSVKNYEKQANEQGGDALSEEQKNLIESIKKCERTMKISQSRPGEGTMALNRTGNFGKPVMSGAGILSSTASLNYVLQNEWLDAVVCGAYSVISAVYLYATRRANKRVKEYLRLWNNR